MTDIFADKLTAARSRIAASLLPKISSAVAASSASKLTATPMGNNLKEHIANGGQPTNDMINYFNDKTIADGVNRQNISDAQQNDYYGVSTANLTSSNVFMAAAANAANLAGGAVGTLAQWGNTLAGDQFTAQAIAMEAGTPAHVVDAYNTLNRTREQKNQLAEQSRVIREQIRNKQGDPIQLNAQLLAIETAYRGIQVDPNVMNTLSVKNGDTTYLEKLDASQELRHKGARVTAGSGEGILPAMKSSDFSNPYYKKPLEQANKGDQFIADTNALADRQLDEGTLTGTLQGIGNKVLATGKSIGNVLAAGVDSPMGVLQYTAESAPYFALPGIGTVAIVNQTAVEGRHKFEERTGQALPTTGQNAAMLATDALYGALNYMGDRAVNSAIRGTTAAPVRSSRQVLLDSVKGVGSTGLRAAGKEGFAEGAQTYLENSGQNLDTYFDPNTIGQAAAIGAMSSGVVLAPSSVRNGINEAKANLVMNSPAGQAALAEVEKQKVLDAIPLAELQDTAGANFNPVEAINRMTTGVTEATKDTVIADVSALVNNLQDVVTERETNLANAELKVAEATRLIPIIDQLIASGNTDPALVEGRKNYVDYLEGDGSPQRIKEQQNAVESATSELINAHEHAKIKLKAVRDAFGVANPNTAAPSVPSVNPSTGGTVYPYPSKGAGLRAALEANDSTKNYTPEQRDTLRAFSDAVVLIHSNKDLQKVGIDIKQGGNTGGQKYRGLEQYMERVVEAINNGNVRSQQYFNKGLALFSQSHTSKAETFQKAFDTLTPGMVNIVQKNDDTNTWEIYDTVTEKVFNSGNFKEGLKNTGGYGIHRNSLKFIETVKSEAEGIAQVSDAINLMVNGSQSVAPTPAVPAPVVAPTPPIDTKPSDTTAPVVTPVPPVIKAWKGVGNSVSKAASSDLGFFATTSKEYASQYAKTGIPELVEVTLTNPYQMTFSEFREIDRGLSNKKASVIAQELKAKGHDGIIVTHTDGVQELITFDRSQIVFPNNKDLNSLQKTVTPATPVTPTETSVESILTSKDEASKALGRLRTTFAIMGTPTVDEVTSEQVAQWKYNNGAMGRTQSGIDAINADIAKVESYLATKVTKTPPPSQDTTTAIGGGKQAPKIGETSTVVKGRFTITKTVVSDNTVLSVHTNNEDGKVTKSEYVTTYPDIYSDELGDKYTVVIYRDSANPSTIIDVKTFDAKDKKNTSGSYGKAGTQTDEQYVTTFTEAGDVTLEYTDKFEKPLAKVISVKQAPETTEDTGKDNKADLILPIGTSGSGKSTWIKSVNSKGDYTVISLDGLRIEMTGDIDNKTSDEAVYTEAVNRAVAAVKAGKQVIFDTTNLKKDRRAVIIEAIRKAKPDANIQYKLLPLDPALAKQRIKDALAKGEARANVSDATIDRHAASYAQALEDIKQEGITAFPEPKAKESTEVVVVPETVVPVTPPDSETGDVEIQEDVSSFPEVAEPKEKVTPEGGLSILSIPEGLFVPEGISPVKANMEAEQEKAADQILRAGSTIVVDRSKVDKEDGRVWLAKVATTTKEIITTGIQRANLVIASFYQKAKAPSKLVQVKDFAAKVLAMSPTEQAQMLSDALGETATDSQVQFLESFLMFDKSLRGTIDAMAVPSGQDGFRFKDYLQYLYTDIKSETKTVKILNKKTKTLEDVDQVITTGTLDENVKTAISLGIHTFLIEKTGQFTLDHEGVAELLGIKNTKSVPPEIHRMFRSIGNTQPNVVKYLGTKAYQALQISMDPNVPTQRKESLINALGSLAVQTMLKEGLLQYTRISNDTILNAKAAIKGETNTVNPSNSFTLYLRPTYDTKKTVGKDGWVYETEPKSIPKIEAIKLSAKGNTKVMAALFSIEGRDILPMLKMPTKFTQNTLSKTGNEVPDATADLVLQMMQKAYNVNGYTYSAMKTLFESDPDALYAMVGVVSDEDVAKQHISIRGATESKNEALKRSIVNGLEFIDSLTTDENGNFPDYYLPMSVWSVNRVGVSSNLFNEQGDKVHRALTTMTAHKQQVTISPVVDSENKLTQYGRFLTGVAAYMEGIKINGKTVDKTDGVSFLPGFEAYISTPEFKEVIESVGALVLGTATAEDIERVQIEVIKLEGGAMSLTSLIALYEASKAVDGVFTTSMSTGSDGVTNGMALSLLMYDAASLSEDFVSAMSWKEKNAFNKASPKAKVAILQAKKDAFDLANPKDTKGMTKAEKDAFNAGGIFFEGDSESSMVAFRRSGKADLYQQLAKVQKDLLQKYVQDNKQNTELLEFIAAMNNIDPTFGTRAGAKVSLVPFVYGSGFRSIGAAQSRAFMEEFYKALTKAKLSKDANKIRQFQANYIALAQAVGTPREEIVDFVNLTVQEALDTELTLKQIKAITGLENKIRSQITEEALSQVAGTLIQSRKRVSGLANVGFESYNRLYRALYDQAYAKLAEGKFLPYRIGTSGSLIGEKIVVEGMSASQNQKVNDELKDFTPQIYSVGGVFSTNGERSAHSMWSEDQIQDPTDTGTTNPTFGATTEGKALPTPNSDGAIFPSKSITTNLHIRSVKSRGAATNAAVVLAMDAWITAKVSAAMDTFNHHDENVSSIDKAAEMGQLQNKTLFNAVLDYDVYLEVLNGSLLRPLRGIIKLSKRDDTLAIAKGEVGKVMADLRQYMKGNFGGFNEDMGMLASLVHEMYALEIAKLTKYKNLKSVSQYGIEGGEYTVTKKDVARINDLIASHVASRTALLKEVAQISADLKAIGAKPKAEPVVKPETKEETPKGKPASVDSFIVRNEEGLVNVLATLNSMPINDSTLVGKVIKQVVEALKGKLPSNLKVHMVTGNNLPTALDKENVKDTLSRGSAGVTYSVGNTHTIGLVEGKAGKVTFIHELIHASTVSGLSGTSAEARKLKVNISKLRSEALSAYRKYTASLAPVSKIEAERRDKVFMDAFNSEGDKDVEFVAMAMSEPAIIDFLATVPAPKLSSVDTGLISIFSAFIKSVSEFLGLTKNAKGKDVESVLSAMVNQTSHLMNINDQSSASDQVNNYPGQQAAVDAVRLIREYPSKEVFNVLPASLDVGFDTYLSSLMDSIVDKTFNHLSFPATTYTPLEVWENAITDGRTPYTTRAVAAGFILSERELFAIETLEVALKGAMDAGITTPVYKEMERAYESARKTLKPESFYTGDWATALESDREIARNKYKHLFKMEGGQATRSDYMSRFMAMALASSEVNSLLGFPTLTEPRVDGTISSKVLAYYEYAMDWVSGHLTGTMRYQTINSKLPTLAQKLVDIDHKKRDQALSSVYDTVSDNLNKADAYLKESSSALADKLENMIGDSKKGLPSAARTASRVVLRGAAMDMLNVAKIWRDMSAPNTVLGWKGELLNELSDPSSIGQAVRSLLRIHTRLQTERKTHKSTTKESILSNFLNGGKNLSKDDHSAITYGVLRGDLKALYDLHGIRGIEKLLNNADEVDAEVARLEGLITNETHLVRAKDLAHYMTSGEVNLMLAKNALSIARDVGLPTVLDEDMVSEEAVSNIDMLVSLYAIQYMKSSHLQTLQKLFKQEGARTDGNGLAALMKYHQAIEQEAKDTLFEGNSVSIIKGYTPEITNPHREIKIVTLATDAKHLEAMGYQLHSILSADPNDVNQAKRMMYFTEEPSTQRFVTGAMSLTADSPKGTSIIDGSSLSVKDKISALKSITTRSVTKLKAKSAKDYDPTAVRNRGISPTYSNLGSIQDFRYEMTHATRDGLLQRNNNFAEIMGTYAGSNFDKASTPKHNETVIDALYKDYKENYLKDPRAYVMIGKDATDPKAVEMYAMLPYKTRKYIDKVWGKREPMWVRNDALLATFGTNKYSIGEAFEKNPDTRNLVETTIVDMFKVLFGDTAKLRALQGERLNQELVSWFKSTIVIRNLTTLMGNQSANVGVLLVMGVSPVDIIKDSVTAFKAGNRFRKDNTELVRVENNMKANVGNFEDNVQLQARLKDSIARNPLKQFLDAGMLNTIVEDVSLDVEDYNYKSKLAQQLDDQLDKLNPTVRKIGANLVVAPSTELYQVLANATQLSDFTAKYTLYKHLTSKAKDKLSHEDALAMADRMFINYDVPTSKELQYANDMGFIMFTKYTLRIQRAIAYLLKERKASLLAQGMLGTALGMPLATAPAFFNVIGNPLLPGALMVPGALTQPLPIKVLSGGF